MIKSLDGIVLIVKDIEKQKKFYRDILGLKIESDYGSAIFFRIGKQKLALFTKEHHPEGTKSLEGAKKGISHLEFGISKEDYVKIKEKLKKHGFQAYQDNYKDADGNLFHFNIDDKIIF